MTQTGMSSVPICTVVKGTIMIIVTLPTFLVLKTLVGPCRAGQL